MIDLPNSLILGICHLIFYFYGYKDHLDRCTPSLDLFAKLLQLCLTLYNPMDYSPPGFSVHGILQARILEWGAIFLLQVIFPTQGSNPHLLHLLH